METGLLYPLNCTQHYWLSLHKKTQKQKGILYFLYINNFWWRDNKSKVYFIGIKVLFPFNPKVNSLWLKAARSAGKRQLDDAGDIDNVYDVVDVDEYSELVSKRQNDDWIVDDDGGYTEDGREIFDEEMGDEVDGYRSTKSEKGKKVGNPAKIRKKTSDASATSEESSSSTTGVW